MNPFHKAALACLLGAAVLGGVSAWGSPHLRITYNSWECWYFGLNGWELDGIGATCPLVKVFRWR